MRKLTGLTASLFAAAAVLAGSALAAATQNTDKPSFDGKQMVGQTLTAKNGSWSNRPTSFEYQWQRCDSSGSSCGSISGQTARTYRLTDSDVGNPIPTSATRSASSSRRGTPTDRTR